MAILKKIDELTVADHAFISVNSRCFYFLEYPMGPPELIFQDPNFSFIKNFKKTPDRFGRPEWWYKEQAISRAATLIEGVLTGSNTMGIHTLIPIPPSKIKGHPLYDDRMSRVLHEVVSKHSIGDFREVLSCINNKQSSHSSKVRPTIEELMGNLTVDEGLLSDARQSIVLVDDVLTTGAHFVAASRKLHEYRPDLSITGLFLARRVPDQETFDVTDFLSP